MNTAPRLYVAILIAAFTAVLTTSALADNPPKNAFSDRVNSGLFQDIAACAIKNGCGPTNLADLHLASDLQLTQMTSDIHESVRFCRNGLWEAQRRAKAKNHTPLQRGEVRIGTERDELLRIECEFVGSTFRFAFIKAKKGEKANLVLSPPARHFSDAQRALLTALPNREVVGYGLMASGQVNLELKRQSDGSPPPTVTCAFQIKESEQPTAQFLTTLDPRCRKFFPTGQAFTRDSKPLFKPVPGTES